MLPRLLLVQLQMIFFCGRALLMSKENDTELHIGTLIPYYTRDPYDLRKAVEFAAETIYKRGLLKGYKLVFHHKDTLGTPDKGVEALIALRNENVKICVIGPLKSEVAIYTARLASVWGTLQVSYSASSPDLLSDTYPRFLSLMPTSYSLNAALIKFMEFFKWNRVALALDANYKKSVFPPTMNALKQKLKDKGVKILTTELVDVTKSDTIKSFVRTLKEKDARIVIALLEDETLFTVICEAYKEGFYGKSIVWFNYYNRAKFSSKSRCNRTEFAMITERLFVLGVANMRNDSNKTISGLTSKEFEMKMLGKRKRLGIRSALAFDTTWLLALAINASIKDAVRMQHVKLSTNDHIGLSTKLRKRMMNMDFEGISGRVTFNSSERLGTIVIKQMRKGRPHLVAEHQTLSNILTFRANQSKPKVLFDADKNVQDGPFPINEVRHYSLSLFVVIWILCFAASVVALVLFTFNFRNRKIRYIKMSSPNVNNIIIFGGFLCIIKVILDTIDSRFVSLQSYANLCNVRVWFMSLGFTTAFGAMFSKTWRVHRIFTASKNFRRAVIKNFHLYGLLLVLLTLECIILTAWMIISPYTSDILDLPVEENKEKDVLIYPRVFHCTSKHDNIFLITSLAFKGLLLVFGIFLAWETRNIEIKALNDSKYIGISVYNVVILSVIGVILATLMSASKYYNVYLALMSFVVIICTAATLGIVFVPKIIGLRKIIKSSAKVKVSETTYSMKSSSADEQGPCSCCDNCKYKSAIPSRKASIHVSNKFLAGSSNNRRKSKTTYVPSMSVNKPKVSVHIDAKVCLSAYPIAENLIQDENTKAGITEDNDV